MFSVLGCFACVLGWCFGTVVAMFCGVFWDLFVDCFYVFGSLGSLSA